VHTAGWLAAVGLHRTINSSGVNFECIKSNSNSYDFPSRRALAGTTYRPGERNYGVGWGYEGHRVRGWGWGWGLVREC
jgi:hypothetical protein